MLFPSILRRQWPQREVGTRLRCRPDVFAAALEARPGSAASSMGTGLLDVELSSALARPDAHWAHCMLGRTLAQGAFSESGQCSLPAVPVPR